MAGNTDRHPGFLARRWGLILFVVVVVCGGGLFGFLLCRDRSVAARLILAPGVAAAIVSSGAPYAGYLALRTISWSENIRRKKRKIAEKSQLEKVADTLLEDPDYNAVVLLFLHIASLFTLLAVLWMASLTYFAIMHPGPALYVMALLTFIISTFTIVILGFRGWVLQWDPVSSYKQRADDPWRKRVLKQLEDPVTKLRLFFVILSLVLACVESGNDFTALFYF